MSFSAWGFEFCCELVRCMVLHWDLCLGTCHRASSTCARVLARSLYRPGVICFSIFAPRARWRNSCTRQSAPCRRSFDGQRLGACRSQLCRYSSQGCLERKLTESLAQELPISRSSDTFLQLAPAPQNFSEPFKAFTCSGLPETGVGFGPVLLKVRPAHPQ